VAGSILLFVAELSWRSISVEQRLLWIVCICAGSALLLVTLAWWWLNVMLERWAN
jgi:hypothetical protein